MSAQEDRCIKNLHKRERHEPWSNRRAKSMRVCMVPTTAVVDSENPRLASFSSNSFRGILRTPFFPAFRLAISLRILAYCRVETVPELIFEL